jgi:transcriptional regulator with XRE-family HTH domain
LPSAVRERTDEPFAAALRALLSERGLSRRRLAQLSPSVDGRGLGHSYVSGLASGERQPTVENMRLLAALLDVAPSFFYEYRVALAQARTAMLVELRGPDAVLAKLAELDA